MSQSDGLDNSAEHPLLQDRLAQLRARLHDATDTLSAHYVPEEGLVLEGRLERLDQALGSIGLNYSAIEVGGSVTSEQVNDELLPVELMHRVYGAHPWLRHRRPPTRPVNLRLTDSAEIFLDCTRDWPLLAGLEEEHRLKELIDKGLSAFSDMTDPDTEPGLLQAVLEGTDAYLRFIEGNVRLPLIIVNSYKRYQARNDESLDLSSLYFVGLQSLPKAIQKFDPEKGFTFSTYAMFWIRQAISREVRVTRRLVRLPEAMDLAVRNIRAFSELFAREHGRQPSAEELYQQGYTPDELYYERASKPAVSLDAPAGNDDSDTSLGDFIGALDSAFDDVIEEGGIEAQISSLVDRAALTHHELAVLSIRYNLSLPQYPEVNRRVQQFRNSLLKSGLATYNPDKVTYAMIARSFSLSSEAIRRAEKRALSKLRSTQAERT